MQKSHNETGRAGRSGGRSRKEHRSPTKRIQKQQGELNKSKPRTQKQAQSAMRRLSNHPSKPLAAWDREEPGWSGEDVYDLGSDEIH